MTNSNNSPVALPIKSKAAIGIAGFDATDIILNLINEPAARRNERYRLKDWLLERELPIIITRSVR